MNIKLKECEKNIFFLKVKQYMGAGFDYKKYLELKKEQRKLAKECRR
jgi:hypothetical protein